MKKKNALQFNAELYGLLAKIISFTFLKFQSVFLQTQWVFGDLATKFLTLQVQSHSDL